jgi:hypothetical protein
MAGLHHTGNEGGAEKDRHRGCYELYYGWEHGQWPLRRAAEPAALRCGTAPTNGKRDRHGHLSNGTGRGNHENLPRPSLYGGLARRVRLTRVAGREQELRSDDRAVHPKR